MGPSAGDKILREMKEDVLRRYARIESSEVPSLHVCVFSVAVSNERLELAVN